MQVDSQIWSGNGSIPATSLANPQLVLALGERALLAAASAQLVEMHPGAFVVAASTSGEIAGTSVAEHTVVVTRIAFASTTCRVATAICAASGDSEAAGQQLGAALAGADLRHVIVFSNGLLVNGTTLAAGLQSAVGPQVSITGGLAGDGAAFGETSVLVGGVGGHSTVAAVGLYGDALEVGTGSQGGWQRFGPVRHISRADGSVLYELDGKSALAKYKEYLGDHAAALPSSALLFPIFVTRAGAKHGVVRTVLTVDEASQSMTFAGDMPSGGSAQLMHANTDGLVAGAEAAAQAALAQLSGPAEFALLVSCVGRRLVMNQRVEEEVEAVRDVIGDQVAMAGFYSYGELCPQTPGADCELLNQTMTITLLRERA